MARMEYKWVVASVSTLGLFMELLDATIVNVAIPDLAREFEAKTTTIEWIITGYLLSLAVFIPVSGWAGDKFGTKRTFLFALTTFTLASLLCGLAWNVESLILFRVLQGIGGGMMTPVGTAMLFRAFPPQERSKAAGIMTIPTTVAPASGPIVGGFLIEYVNWQWIFLVNLPVGIFAIIFCMKFLREHKEPQPGAFDPYGFALAAAGLAAVLYGLAEAGTHGFDDPRVLAALLGGLAVLALFVLVELRVKAPMLDVRLFQDRLFRASTVVQLVAFCGFSGALFLLPIMLQAQRGLNAFESGLTTFPMAIGVMTIAQPASRLYRVVGPRRMVIAGLLLTAVSAFLLAGIDLQTSEWEIRGIMLLRGWGFGLMIVSLQAAAFSGISPAMTGRASSFYSSSRMVAQSLGVAIAATVLTTRLADHGAVLGNRATDHGAVLAFRDGYIVAGVFILLAIVGALLIRDSDAAATMRARPGARARLAEDETAPASAR